MDVKVAGSRSFALKDLKGGAAFFYGGFSGRDLYLLLDDGRAAQFKTGKTFALAPDTVVFAVRYILQEASIIDNTTGDPEPDNDY